MFGKIKTESCAANPKNADDYDKCVKKQQESPSILKIVGKNKDPDYTNCSPMPGVEELIPNKSNKNAIDRLMNGGHDVPEEPVESPEPMMSEEELAQIAAREKAQKEEFEKDQKEIRANDLKKLTKKTQPKGEQHCTTTPAALCRCTTNFFLTFLFFLCIL